MILSKWVELNYFELGHNQGSITKIKSHSKIIAELGHKAWLGLELRIKDLFVILRNYMGAFLNFKRYANMGLIL